MLYSVLKAVHIVFMVSYFAGIFYLVRIFVYYKDTDSFEDVKQKILREQYTFMARRLWNIITVPAFVLMLFSGLSMLFYYFPHFPLLSTAPFSWFYFKILFLLVLFIYHFWCWKMVLKLKESGSETLPHANIKLRQANEVATFLLFLIVFLAVLKYAALENWWQLILGFAVLVTLIMTTVKLVNKKR